MKLFISHSKKDEELAKRLVTLLEKALIGLSAKDILCTSLPGYKLYAGDSVGTTLKNKAVNSVCFLALISPQSLKSTYVSFELGARWGSSKPIIPILSPDASNQDIKAPLNEFHFIQSNNKSDLYDLIDRLSNELDLEINRVAAYSSEIDSLENYKPPVYELYNTIINQDDDSYFTKTFTVAVEDKAETAQLLGDFTNWEAAPIPMTKIRDNLFGVSLRMKNGTYKFKYKVDGKWKETMTDDSPTVKNHHGSWNYIIER
jgi:hypothetical protein